MQQVICQLLGMLCGNPTSVIQRFFRKASYPIVEHKPQLSRIKFAISYSTCKMSILYLMSTCIAEARISKSTCRVVCWVCSLNVRHARIA